jgi:hypothetical protein
MIKIYRAVLELESGEIYTFYRETVQTSFGERIIEGTTTLSEATAPLNTESWGNEELRQALANKLKMNRTKFEVLKMPAQVIP